MLTQPPKQCLICWYLASAGQLIITVGRGPSQTVVSGSQVTCDWEIIDNWKIQGQTLWFGLHVLKMQQKLPKAANLVNTGIWAQGNIWQMGRIRQQNVLSMDYFLRLPQTPNCLIQTSPATSSGITLGSRAQSRIPCLVVMNGTLPT